MPRTRWCLRSEPLQHFQMATLDSICTRGFAPCSGWCLRSQPLQHFQMAIYAAASSHARSFHGQGGVWDRSHCNTSRWWPRLAACLHARSFHGQGGTCDRTSHCSTCSLPCPEASAHAGSSHGHGGVCDRSHWCYTSTAWPLPAADSHVHSSHGQGVSCLRTTEPLQHMQMAIPSSLHSTCPLAPSTGRCVFAIVATVLGYANDLQQQQQQLCKQNYIYPYSTACCCVVCTGYVPYVPVS